MSAAVAPSDVPLRQLRPKPICTVQRVVLTVLESLVCVSCGIVLVAGNGRDEDDMAFYGDIAALCFACTSVATVGCLLILDLVSTTYPDSRSRLIAQLSKLSLLLHLNVVGLTFFTLMTYATLALFQVLLVFQATCWTTWCWSTALWAYRKGLPEGTRVNWLPVAKELLDMPRWALLAAWAVFAALAGALYSVKPKESFGLPEELGWFEVYLLYSLGGSAISTLLVALFLFATPRGRKLVLFSKEAASAVGHGEAFLRAFLISVALHLFGSAFVFLAMYAVIAVLIVLMARSSLRGSRPPKRDPNAEAKDEQGVEHTESANARLKKRKKRDRSIANILTRIVVVSFGVLFGVAKVCALFCVFLFDVVFVQRQLAKTTTAHFILARQDRVCGTSEELLQTDAHDAIECAAISGANFQAFSLGKGDFAGHCYGHMLPSSYDDASYMALKQDVHAWACEAASNETTWNSKVGFDFYVLEPTKSCSVVRRLTTDMDLRFGTPPSSVDASSVYSWMIFDAGVRRLQGTTNNVGDETLMDGEPVYNYQSTKEMPEASGDLVGSNSFSDAVGFVMEASRWILSTHVRVPEAIAIKCSGVRRLTSAYALFGAVFAILAVAVLDVLSVLAAATEIAKARAPEAGSFVKYMFMIARAAALEQAAIFVLQIAIASGSNLQYEARGIFVAGCGVLVQESNYAGLDCPVFWNFPVDAFASALIFISMIMGVGIVLGVFGGVFYGLEPARWAIVALFGEDLQLARFKQEEASPGAAAPSEADGAGDGLLVKSASSSADQTASSSSPKMQRKTPWWQRPLMGLPVSFGVWTSWTSREFQIGRRQHMYQPAWKASEESDSATSDLVNWRSMYVSTAKVVSLAWLPIPLVGALLSKCVQYLNEYVIFAFGTDGEANGDLEPISSYFEQDSPRSVNIMHWTTYAAQLLIMVAIEFDLLGGDRNARLPILSGCVAIVIVIAFFRVFFDVVREFMVFVNARGLVDFAAEVIEDGVPAQVVKRALDRDESEEHVGEDPLHGLCGDHYTRVIRSSAELLELTWVRERRLPGDYRTLLVSERSRLSKWNRSVRKALTGLASSKAWLTKGMAEAMMILLLRDIADNELLKIRADKAAREKSQALARVAAEEVGHERQRHALSQAKQHAVVEAAARVQAHVEAVQLAAAKRRRGEGDGTVPDPPRWLRLKFADKSTCKSVAVGRMKGSDMELGQRRESITEVVATGEVELQWDDKKRPEDFKVGDVVALDSRHQIIVLQAEDDEESTDALVEDARVAAAAPPKGPESCAPDLDVCRMGWWDDELAHECCRCCRGTRGSDKLHADDGVEKYDVHEVSTDKAKDVSWSAAVEPEALATEDAAEALGTIDSMEVLEAALRDSVYSATAVALSGAFLNALAADTRSLSATEASRRARLLALTSRMLRNRRKRAENTSEAPREKVEQVYEPDNSIELVPPKEDAIQRIISKVSMDSAQSQSKVEEQPPKIEKVRSRRISNTGFTGASPLETLRAAMINEPMDADELSMAIDQARRSDVDPILLTQAEGLFMNLLEKQQKAVGLLQAIENRMIGSLRSAIAQAEKVGMTSSEFPDSCGEGVLSKARRVLRQEENSAVFALRSAVEAGGALRLQRAIEQAKEAQIFDSDLMQRAEEQLRVIGERKRRICLLKMAMASNNAELLKQGIEECRKDGFGDSGSDAIDVKRAEELLVNLERAADKLKSGVQARREAEAQAAAAEAEAKRKVEAEAARRASVTASNAAWPHKPLMPKQIRANAALRAAVYQEPPEADLLRLALAQAKAAGITGPEVDKAEELLAQEENKEQMLHRLRKGTATNDIREISESVKQCRDLGVDPKKLLTALTQLIEEHAKVARKAGDHGLSSVILADIEQQRVELHNSILQSHGSLRTICRVRPHEGDPDSPGHDAQRLDSHSIWRVDRFTVAVKDDKYRFGSVFGPDSIQAEVFNDMRGLIQSAVDGYNVLIMACGPSGSGKTHTMRGGGSQSEGRGVIPRAVDELFALRDRDSWRTSLDIDVQMVEVPEAHQVTDALGSRASLRGPDGMQYGHTSAAPTVRVQDNSGVLGRTRSGTGEPGKGASSKCVVIDNVATRRVGGRTELRSLVDEGYSKLKAAANGHLGHVLVIIHLTRTNRATGSMSRSKLVFADMAGVGSSASDDVDRAYRAVEGVFQALAQRKRRVPFREHMLTRLVEDCIGGSAKTALVVNLPPSTVGHHGADFVEALRCVRLATFGNW